METSARKAWDRTRATLQASQRRWSVGRARIPGWRSIADIPGCLEIHKAHIRATNVFNYRTYYRRGGV